jgi:hypothetical protein
MSGTRTLLSWSKAAWLIGITLYFALALIPQFGLIPETSGIALLYVLTVPITLLVLLVVGLWGLLGLMRRPTAQQQRTRALHRLWIVVSAFGSFALVVLVGNVLPEHLPYGSDQLPFDSARWLAESSMNVQTGDVTDRQRMLRSAVDMLPGLDGKAIEKMLGPSESTPYFASTGRDMIYILGPERSFMSIDSEWLLIWLDARGHFKRFTIARD